MTSAWAGDFTLQRRTVLAPADLPSINCDLFISAYNDSERLKTVFHSVSAARKVWLIHAEYGLGPNDFPSTGQVFVPSAVDEAEFWMDAFQQMGISDLSGLSVVIDATGFMRPHLIFLLAFARTYLNAATVDFLYTDPVRYVKNESTVFSDGPVVAVRQVPGFGGVHRVTAVPDLLIIGTGYDSELIRRVAEDKSDALKMQMFGLPSLQPHMYQDNRLQAALAEEAARSSGPDGTLFAPANNPFVTAQVLREAVERKRLRGGVNNLYLSPLGTKAQVLGFAMYYLAECVNTPASIIFPYAEKYARETTQGVARVWRYSVELDWLMM